MPDQHWSTRSRVKSHALSTRRLRFEWTNLIHFQWPWGRVQVDWCTRWQRSVHYQGAQDRALGAWSHVTDLIPPNCKTPSSTNPPNLSHVSVGCIWEGCDELNVLTIGLIGLTTPGWQRFAMSERCLAMPFFTLRFIYTRWFCRMMKTRKQPAHALKPMMQILQTRRFSTFNVVDLNPLFWSSYLWQTSHVGDKICKNPYQF